ncbi:MAG: hypothetical protein QM652_13365 [Legionella sp.]|uniref:hypothetical protein n=1 Tax=Legionella sp. TaxID=459 RepID=UPI0039E3BEB4
MTTGLGLCGNPFVLPGKGSCILSLQINGSQLSAPIVDEPIVSRGRESTNAIDLSISNILRITQAPPLTDAVITVTGSPLTLTADGIPGQLIIINTSIEVAATNILSNFTGTTLDRNVTETGNTWHNQCDF